VRYHYGRNPHILSNPYRIQGITEDREEFEFGLRMGHSRVLFGKAGGTGGCWRMYWRLRHKDFEAHKGAGTRALMHT
jgi:hypothetical protein